jgi:hypothetical protein
MEYFIKMQELETKEIFKEGVPRNITTIPPIPIQKLMNTENFDLDTFQKLEEVDLKETISQIKRYRKIFDDLTSLELSNKKCYKEILEELGRKIKTMETQVDYTNGIQDLMSSIITLPPNPEYLLFIPFSYIMSNPILVDIAINIFSSYLYDLANKRANKNDDLRVKFIAVTDSATGKVTKVSYDGPLSGVKVVASILKDLKK